MPKLHLDRVALGARRESIPPPLIPLQQPSRPLIPLQVPAPHARLQHELSHKTANLPAHTITSISAPTELPSLQLRRRQNVVTTVTDADIVVIDRSGHTIATTMITGVRTGSLTITLPFTTVTVPPIASISGVFPVPTANPNPIPNPAPTALPGTDPSLGPASSLSVQIPNASTQQGLASPLPTPGIPVPAASGTSNNQLAAPNSPAATASFSMVSGNVDSASITAPSSSTITPSTFATSISTSSSSSGSSSSANTSTSLRSSTSSSSSSRSSSGGFPVGPTGSGTGVPPTGPTATGNSPAASSTAATIADGSNSSVNVPVVGGVVGGLAGLALLLVLVLLVLRWWRRRSSRAIALRSIDDETYPPGTSSSNAPMTQNTAAAGALGGAGFGAMFKRLTAGSTVTTETSPSEKGFQNFGGRKLESVLVSGGDGYGEPSRSGAHTPTSLSRGWADRFPYETPSKHSSMIVGPATPYRRQSESLSGVAELSGSAIGRPDSDTLKMMPGPARSATYTAAGDPGSHSSTRLSPPRSNLLESLGQGRYSQEGAKGSKFTEDI